jgi:DNA-binding winged helix-turn-helix (wHTH) protein/Tol biopolymer transport system component
MEEGGNPREDPQVTKVNNGSDRIRFGQFEVDLGQGRLLKRGTIVRLENRPFQVLAALLENPGNLMTRQELQSRLWPAGTYVDFDEGLNTAVRKLRIALGDSPDSPVFIETVPRRGYIFVAPVSHETTAPVEASAAQASGNFNGFERAAAPLPEKPGLVSVPLSAPAKSYWKFLPVGVVALIIAFVSLGLVRQIRKLMSVRTEPQFVRLSFGRGLIKSARFAPDGQSVIYGAAWEGKPVRLFLARTGNSDVLALNAEADVLAISRSGQMAVLLHRRFGEGVSSRGTLGLMSMTGESPREVLEDVSEADWSPDGTKLAVIHWKNGKCRLEYPIGNAIYETSNGIWMSDVRLSPAGDRVGFLEHPIENDDAGHVISLRLSGRREVLSKDFYGIVGLAWTPGADRLLFGASEAGVGGGRALFRVGLDGKTELLRRETGHLTIQDVARDGSLLLTRDVQGDEVFGHFPPYRSDRSLGWMSISLPTALSDDGTHLLLSVQGELTGAGYQAFLISTGQSGGRVLLGEGMPTDLSPGSKAAVVLYPWGIQPSATSQIRLVTTGPETPRNITQESMTHVWAGWFPDGKRLIFVGAQTGHVNRSWRQDLDGGKPVPITPEGVTGIRISPDGRTLAAVDATNNIWLYPVEEGRPRLLTNINSTEEIDRWSGDGRRLFLTKYGLPAEVYQVDTKTGDRTLLYRLAPADPAGVLAVGPVLVTKDGKSYVYAYTRVLSTLYVAQGL